MYTPKGTPTSKDAQLQEGPDLWGDSFLLWSLLPPLLLLKKEEHFPGCEWPWNALYSMSTCMSVSVHLRLSSCVCV